MISRSRKFKTHRSAASAFVTVAMFVFVLLGCREVVGQTDDVQESCDSLQASEMLLRLQSDRFSVRQQAMRQLVESPQNAIALIESKIKDSDGDFRIRALKILEVVALNESGRLRSDESEAAFDCVKRLSFSEEQSLARKASQASFGIMVRQQYLAALSLERLNASVSYARRKDSQRYPIADRVVINEGWLGKRKDLELLTRLLGVSSLELSHKQVDDRLIETIQESVCGLAEIKLAKCSIGDASVESLALIESLREVEILYCPIGPGCLEGLANFRSLTTLRLIGTDVDPTLSALIQQRLPATVDIRRGAFMGIRYSPSIPECRLTSLVPGSGADLAGLRPGDHIIKFGDSEVVEYGDLTKLLREVRLGDNVEVKAIREGKEMSFDVVMGEWE